MRKEIAKKGGKHEGKRFSARIIGTKSVAKQKAELTFNRGPSFNIVTSLKKSKKKMNCERKSGRTKEKEGRGNRRRRNRRTEAEKKRRRREKKGENGRKRKEKRERRIKNQGEDIHRGTCN
jgi:hypothetical protein